VRTAIYVILVVIVVTTTLIGWRKAEHDAKYEATVLPGETRLRAVAEIENARLETRVNEIKFGPSFGGSLTIDGLRTEDVCPKLTARAVHDGVTCTYENAFTTTTSLPPGYPLDISFDRPTRVIITIVTAGGLRIDDLIAEPPYQRQRDIKIEPSRPPLGGAMEVRIRIFNESQSTLSIQALFDNEAISTATSYRPTLTQEGDATSPLRALSLMYRDRDLPFTLTPADGELKLHTIDIIGSDGVAYRAKKPGSMNEWNKKVSVSEELTLHSIGQGTLDIRQGRMLVTIPSSEQILLGEPGAPKQDVRSTNSETWHPYFNTILSWILTLALIDRVQSTLRSQLPQWVRKEG
jgi:hypothetical protein